MGPDKWAHLNVKLHLEYIKYFNAELNVWEDPRSIVEAKYR